jgi:eukaryotic-like serine/threonine-protein kinase
MLLAPGKYLLHYRLVEKIGEGGMGRVWRATDTHLDRDVAIKFPSEDLEADPEWLARFTYEARIVAGLSHANIVTIHAVEEIEGRRFLVMEMVRGRTLDQIIPPGGMPWTEYAETALDIADAIAAAHEHGVTHRDIKPRNIMVDEHGHSKVLDFGLARTTRMVGAATADGGTPTDLLMTSDRVEGTLPYMSPEQLRGDLMDPRADLFSLGVVLYEMATGRRPFIRETSAELIAAILRDEPQPAAELRADLPPRLARILQRTMQKDPGMRYQSARELRRDLERLAEDCGTGHPFGTIRSIAVLPLEDFSGDPDGAFFSDGMTEVLLNNLSRIRALKVISRTSVMQYKGVKRPLTEVANELGVDAIVEGSILRVGGRVRIVVRLIDAIQDRQIWSETYERDLGDILALQSDLAHTIAEQIEVELTPQERAHLSRAGQRIDPAVHEAYLRGRYFWHKRTAESVRRGLACFEQAIELDPGYAPAYAGVADSYIVDGGRYLDVEPKIAYGRAGAAAMMAVQLDDSLAEAHTSLAAVLTDFDWDWRGADREYRRAIELNPNYATAHSWYAEQLSRMGRHDEAVTEARRALELDPVSIFGNMLVAWILYFARRYLEAIAQATRTLELDPDYATALRILGWAYEETGQYEEAIQAHARARDLTGRRPNFTAQLGRAYALAGRFEEARGILAELVETSRTSYVSALDIAIIHAALGEFETALGWMERAYGERSDHLPYIRVNPRLDALRGHVRFRDLLERMGLAVDPTSSHAPEMELPPSGATPPGAAGL